MKKIGKIKVSGFLVDTNTDIVARIFSKMGSVVLRCEHFYDSHLFEYLLYSPLFDDVEQGWCAPEYELNITSYWHDSGELDDFTVDVLKLPYGYRLSSHPTTLELMIEQINGKHPSLRKTIPVPNVSGWIDAEPTHTVSERRNT
jgi:hypothetical protein